MQRLSHFPRLLRFHKWLGVRILNVNSCSILALQTRSSAKFGQVNPDGSKLLWPKPCWENKRGYLTIIRLSFSLFFPALSVLCSDLDLCYFKDVSLENHQQWQIPLRCRRPSLITHVSSTVPDESQWVSVSSGRDRIRMRLQYVCLFCTDGGSKMCTWRLLVKDAPHLYFEFPGCIKLS